MAEFRLAGSLTCKITGLLVCSGLLSSSFAREKKEGEEHCLVGVSTGNIHVGFLHGSTFHPCEIQSESAVFI